MAKKNKIKPTKKSKVTKKPVKKIVAKKPIAKKSKPIKKPTKSAKKVQIKKPAKKIVKATKKTVAKKVTKPAKKIVKLVAKTVAKKPEQKNIKPIAKPVSKNNVVSINTKPKPAPAKMKEVKIKYVDMTPAKLAKKQGLVKRLDLPKGYKPNNTEAYMNPQQLEYFRRKLEDWKKELLMESTETIQHLQSESWNEPDPSDQATIVEQTGLELRTRDRYRKLINKIDAALARIEIGEYGYCEVTGDPIGLARLEARPIATMTIAAQEQHEMEEKINLEG